MNGNGKLAALALLSLVLAAAPVRADDLDKVEVVIPQNSVFVLSYNGAKDAGIFRKYGIDLTVDARPFAAYLAALPAKQTMVSIYAGLEAIDKMNQGLDWAVIGGGLTVFQDLIVRKDSPLKTIADLRGKRFAAISTASGALKSARAAVLDAAGFDLQRDTKFSQLAPPAMFKLLERGDIDAMQNISSFTIKAFSQPDTFRSIFSTNGYWKKKTGYPVAWAAPVVAWKSWIDENPARAKKFAAAVVESFRWLRKPENFDACVKKYGTLAGVTTPEAAATYKKLLSEERLFLTSWDQKVVDAEWQFLELAQHYGILQKAPDKNKHALILN